MGDDISRVKSSVFNHAVEFWHQMNHWSLSHFQGNVPAEEVTDRKTICLSRIDARQLNSTELAYRLRSSDDRTDRAELIVKIRSE